MHVRREAVLSSQIEGTQSSLSDLLLHESGEAPGVPLDDAREVSHYVAAMGHGMRRIREGFPLSLRREIHGILLAKGRGSWKRPGEFRTSQNWIGGTRPGNAVFVPHHRRGCSSAWACSRPSFMRIGRTYRCSQKRRSFTFSSKRSTRSSTATDVWVGF